MNLLKMFRVVLSDDGGETLFEKDIRDSDQKTFAELLEVTLEGYFFEIRTNREYKLFVSTTNVTLVDEDGEEIFETKKPKVQNQTVSDLLNEVIELYIEHLEASDCEYTISVTKLRETA